MAWPDLEIILSPETIFVCFKQLGLGICSLLTYWLFQFVVLSMGPVGAFSFIFFSCNFFPSSTSGGGRTSGPATLAYLVAGWLLYQRSAPSLRHIVAESWQTQPGRPACAQCAERTWSSSYPRCLCDFSFIVLKCTRSFCFNACIVPVSVHSFSFPCASAAEAPHASKLFLLLLRPELQVVPSAFQAPSSPP